MSRFFTLFFFSDKLHLQRNLFVRITFSISFKQALNVKTSSFIPFYEYIKITSLEHFYKYKHFNLLGSSSFFFFSHLFVPLCNFWKTKYVFPVPDAKYKLLSQICLILYKHNYKKKILIISFKIRIWLFVTACAKNYKCRHFWIFWI